jgi:hypothetical protein
MALFPQRTEVNGRYVYRVGFERWDVIAHMLVTVLVHWSRAFEYLKAHDAYGAKIVCVNWQDHTGVEGFSPAERGTGSILTEGRTCLTERTDDADNEFLHRTFALQRSHIVTIER